MPRGDGTGPAGMGPMTGRAAGFCAGYGVPGYMNPVGGRGFRGRGGAWGRGGGRGWRNWFYATGLPRWVRGWDAGPTLTTPAPHQDIDGLKQQAKYLGDALENINKRIEELEDSARSS